jgi:dsRNA-specific ribonuclease
MNELLLSYRSRNIGGIEYIAFCCHPDKDGNEIHDVSVKYTDANNKIRIIGKGKGFTKEEAKQNATRQALELFKDEGIIKNTPKEYVEYRI